MISCLSSGGGFNTKNTLFRQHGAKHCHVAQEIRKLRGKDQHGPREGAGPGCSGHRPVLHPDSRFPSKPQKGVGGGVAGREVSLKLGPPGQRPGQHSWLPSPAGAQEAALATDRDKTSAQAQKPAEKVRVELGKGQRVMGRAGIAD